MTKIRKSTGGAFESRGMPTKVTLTGAMPVREAILQARKAMDTASPDGKQLPRGQAGRDLVEHVGLLRIACGDAPEFSMCISEPLFQLYPYEVTDALGLTTLDRFGSGEGGLP